MPKKEKETTSPKSTATKLNVNRPPISTSSLYYIPEDVVSGFQERLETGINWTLNSLAGQHHKKRSGDDIPKITFSEALRNKINNSIVAGFFNEESQIPLQEHWDLLLPITLWDKEKFSTTEEDICFNNSNSLTDDLVKLIRKAVKLNDRKVLWKELKEVHVLRVNNIKMTDLDNGIKQFNRLLNLNLCGNFIENFDSSLLSRSLRSLELQCNRIRTVKGFVDDLPPNLLHLGLAWNMLVDEDLEHLRRLPLNLTVLDLSDNDIYDLEPLLDILVSLPNLVSLQLAGNPCSVCNTYARLVFARLPNLMWLDSREIIPADRSSQIEGHPDDLRSAYFFFSCFRVMSAVQPPKPEKGSVGTFHLELEIPLLDSYRRRFLMYRRNESLIELLPPPEDYESEVENLSLTKLEEQVYAEEASEHMSDIYKHLTEADPMMIKNYTTFQGNKVPWNKVMTFQEPAVRIFVPDLTILRDTFRSVIEVRLVYTLTTTNKAPKDKKSMINFRPVTELRAVIATMKCTLRNPDWSQPSQHFHWDDSLGTDEAIHWGDGDLSILQYIQGPVKPAPKKQEGELLAVKQSVPENLTCQLGFGIETLK